MKLETNWGMMNLPKASDASVLHDFNVKTAFTCGHCHSFALAIHDATGWQLVGLYRYYRALSETPTHVAVMSPSGRLLDVDGWGSMEDKGYQKMKKFTRKQVVDFQKRDYREPNLPAAIPYVDVLLDNLGVSSQMVLPL